jgi:type II secretory pathway component PulJ
LALRWFLVAFAAVAALCAAAAFARVRRLSKRMERLAESYWELRYEQGQLAARLSRLEAENPQEPERRSAEAFVPLSSLKKT